MASPVQHRWPASKWFYGRLKVAGKIRSVRLDVEVKGEPPRKRGEKGDEAFQRSKWEAEQRLEPLIEEIENLSFPEAIIAIKRFSKAKRKSTSGISSEAGEDYILAEKLAIEWLKLPRKGAKGRTGTSSNEDRSYGAQVVAKIKDFVAFCRKHRGSLKYAFEIEKADAEAYVKAEWERGCTGNTCNKLLTNLGSVFRRLQTRIGNTSNPFDGIERFPKDTISRRAFNEQQVALLYKAGLADIRDVGGVILAGLFTGMREGDCCLLQWSEINLQSGTVQVTVDPKTIERRAEKTSEKLWIPMFTPFREALQKLGPKTSGLVFPEIASRYQSAPDQVSARLVGFVESVFAEDKTFVRQVKRSHGLRSASLYDFAALRTTWITLAVQSGVPTAQICLVSGHTSESMLLKHYLKPDSRSLQASFESKMAALSGLGSENPEPSEDIVHELIRLGELLEHGKVEDIQQARSWGAHLIRKAAAVIGGRN